MRITAWERAVTRIVHSVSNDWAPFVAKLHVMSRKALREMIGQQYEVHSFFVFLIESPMTHDHGL